MLAGVPGFILTFIVPAVFLNKLNNGMLKASFHNLGLLYFKEIIQPEPQKRCEGGVRVRRYAKYPVLENTQRAKG